MMPDLTTPTTELTADESQIIRMAWEDRTSFDEILQLTGYREAEVIALMRRALTRRSFKMWRARVHGRRTKHAALHAQQQEAAHGPKHRVQAHAKALEID